MPGAAAPPALPAPRVEEGAPRCPPGDGSVVNPNKVQKLDPGLPRQPSERRVVPSDDVVEIGREAEPEPLQHSALRRSDRTALRIDKPDAEGDAGVE